MRPHRAVLILVFGILGFVVCPFFGVAAWVMGNTDLKEMAAGRMDSTGKDLTRTGRICGIIATWIFIGYAILVIVMGIAMAIFREP
jgi:hypothetical protein